MAEMRTNRPGSFMFQFGKLGGEQTFAARTAYLAMTTKADIQAISNTVFTHAATSPY